MTEETFNPWHNALKTSVFFLVHLACLGVFFVSFSWTAVAVCVALYFIRMFAITGGYHRYFSHRSYKTSRWFQFLLGLLGTTAAQKGPIWWAANHRHHHQHSDTEEDIHSVKMKGLWHAHVGWVLSKDYLHVKSDLIKDFIKFPEISWLDRNHLVGPIILIAVLVFLGSYLQSAYPELGVTPLSLFIWGFCVSTTLLYHGTFFINSLAHLVGKRRFNTTDESRNSFILALITLGEGWHNNHHRYPGSERQGFYWWEIDITHYILKVLSWFGLVWDLRTPPKRIYDEADANKLAHS
jgi:stearoyl-CoA desaturase (delta-9 desaturase)